LNEEESLRLSVTYDLDYWVLGIIGTILMGHAGRIALANLNQLQIPEEEFQRDCCKLDEMDYWGIDELFIEPCCQYRYTERRDRVNDDIKREAEALKQALIEDEHRGTGHETLTSARPSFKIKTKTLGQHHCLTQPKEKFSM